MKNQIKQSSINHRKFEAEAESKTLFGFWVYIMTDCILFATLFATYAVLRKETNGGPGAAELFSLPYVLLETLLLLTSSFTVGLAILAARKRLRRQTMLWLGATFLLGLAFLGLELNEFNNLVNEGESWRTNAFLSAFFTLVGTHGLHITAGLVWIGVMLSRLKNQGFGPNTLKRLLLLGVFWHFLDVVWIFIFSMVYLLGAAA